MARQATGTIVRRPTKQGTSYSLKMTFAGERLSVQLGGSWEGWTEELVERERDAQATMAQRGVRPGTHINRPTTPPILRSFSNSPRFTEPGEREYREAIASDPCAYCGAPCEEIEHVDCRSAGGPDTWDNLAASCVACNAAKGTKTLLGFLGWRLRESERRALVAEQRAWLKVGAIEKSFVLVPSLGAQTSPIESIAHA